MRSTSWPAYQRAYMLKRRWKMSWGSWTRVTDSRR